MVLSTTAALSATQGARRYQEDTGLLWPGSHVPSLAGLPALPTGRQLAVIADGMGGHVGGAMASGLAATSFARAFVETQTATPGQSLMDHLLACLELANDVLADKVDRQPTYAGMGTTLIGAYVAPHELGSALSWISVGDSLLYLWRRGDLARLNEDHSFGPELDRMVTAGLISAEAAAQDGRRHFLRSALTGRDIEMIDVTPRPLPLASGDYVILASDGIATLAEADIAAVVGQAGASGADAVADALIAAVLDAGVRHQDNTTVIAVAIGDDLSASA